MQNPLPPELAARVEPQCRELLQRPEFAAAPAPLAASLPRVLAASPFVAGLCLSQPELPAALLAEGSLLRARAAGELAQTLPAALAGAGSEAALMRELRRLRNREMLRIAWRDLAGWAELDETLGELSDLADACVAAALDWLEAAQQQRHGPVPDAAGRPLRLTVLGMGKLGGRELNFSSDIDLIFVHGAPAAAGEQAEAYCARLAQALIRVLSERTGDGFVFRVDTLLRPFGRSGPLVMETSAAEEYYQVHGREWERYALIKARPVAGDLAQGEALLRSLRPFVYRRYLDYGAFESLRDMKRMIAEQEARSGSRDNLKLGEGGIREIEFIAQLFQLIRGGHEPVLQNRSLRPVLAQLGREGHLPDYAVRELDEAYVFLRRAENRLQTYADQQEHVLPEEPSRQLALALAMGYPNWPDFRQALERQRRKVRQHFERVFAAPQTTDTQADEPGRLAALLDEELDDAQAQARLEAAGLADADSAEFLRRARLGQFMRGLSEQGRRRLRQLLPLLLGAARSQPQPGRALQRVWQVIESVARRVTYLALLAEHPAALSQLLALCAASPWITELLARHPVLLDELLDPRSLYRPPRRAELAAELAQLAASIAEDDLEAQMDLLRRFRQTSTLRVAAADVSGSLPLMVVSDHLTELAEVVVERALDIAWRLMRRRHGLPRHAGGTAGFAVIAYGKFGGVELGYGSDLDLVFVHDGQLDGLSDGERPLEHGVYFTRLAQKMIHLLSTQTPAGIAYEVDMQLRPSGNSGLLVTRLAALREYQLGQAWTWEHQALVRARAVAGDAALCAAFEALRLEVLARPRDPGLLLQDIREMRQRMRDSLDRPAAGCFDLKHGRGGITDIEFIVQYLVLHGAGRYPELPRYSDNIRQLEALAHCGLLPPAEAGQLADGYRALRRRIHALRLQGEGSAVPEGEFRRERAWVTAIWDRLFGAAAAHTQEGRSG